MTPLQHLLNALRGDAQLTALVPAAKIVPETPEQGTALPWIAVSITAGDDSYSLGGPAMREQSTMIVCMADSFAKADAIQEHVRRIVDSRFATTPGFMRNGVELSDYVERQRAFRRGIGVRVTM